MTPSPQISLPPTPERPDDRRAADVPAHIICVDDEEGILHALRQQLAPFEEAYEVDLAQSGAEALELLDELEREHEPVAMMIADQIMPGMRGAELLEHLHQRHPDAIKILLTGQAGLDAVVQAINSAGLDRYIAKPWDEPDLRITVETLLAKYRLELENVRLIDDLRHKNEELSQLNAELEGRVHSRTAELATANERLAQLAITDGLTGAFNHRYFYERLALEVERSRRNQLPLSLLMIDVDLFKGFNDRYGHLAGDEALRRVADLIRTDRRANDVVARYGGEEFTVVLPDTAREAAVNVAEQIRRRVETTRFPAGEQSEKVTISIGVAACPADAQDVGTFVHAADLALYQAKGGGRNQVAAYDDSEAADEARSVT